MTAEALSSTPPVPKCANPPKTAFVFAGGGSFGSIQVGMLRALLSHGVTADMVVGSSVGAMNAAYFRRDADCGGRRETCWHLAFAAPPRRVSNHVANHARLYPTA